MTVFANIAGGRLFSLMIYFDKIIKKLSESDF